MIAPLVRRDPDRRESGQAVLLLVLALVPLLGIAGFVIDVGYAYYTHRALQASADAAALAGAQQLPDPGASAATAKEYGTGRSAKNRLANVADVEESISTKCLTSVPGCSPVNAVVVDETASVKTLFARVLGVDSFKVHVRSTACSPCGVKPLDIMLVLDRTGSMCEDHYGKPDPSCTDLNNAREGMKTFLSFLDPASEQVGLAVFPPPTSLGTKCSTPSSSNYNSTASPYVVVPLSRDYAANGQLKTSSNLVSTINCQKAGGLTSYATAIEKAQAELDRHGRPDVQDVIVFFSDGAANTGPTYYPFRSAYRAQPCHQGVTSAGYSKAKGTLIYSIGYDLNAVDGGANKCKAYSDSGADEQPPITAYQALQQIATDPGTFYNKPSPGELDTIFTKVAADISRGAAGLVDNGVQ